MGEKTKILFVNTDLRGGGAEKILVNIVNQLDYTKYDVTLLTIFKEGINRQFLNPKVNQKWIFDKPFKGYSRLALLSSPKFLFKKFITEEYDTIISFLEGFPSRIVSGCTNPNTKLISWIHLELYEDTIGYEFRNKAEALKIYNKFDQIVCVAESVKKHFIDVTHLKDDKLKVIYNPLNIDEIEDLANSKAISKSSHIKLVTAGRLNPQKGYDRLLRIIKKLKDDQFDFHFQILGIGPMEQELKQFIADNNLGENVELLGFQTNPYPYIKNADLFVCSSNKEGYSTVVTESVLLETPVITTDCSGMDEILDNGKAGIIVENDEEALYKGLKQLLENPTSLDHLLTKTKERAQVLKQRNSYEQIFSLLSNLHK